MKSDKNKRFETQSLSLTLAFEEESSKMDSTRRAFDPWFDRLESDVPSRFDLSGWDADEMFLPTSRYYSPRYRSSRGLRPSGWIPEREAASGEEKNISKDMFSVKLDVHQFTPEEVTVKTKDNSLIIEARHEEREDQHGFIARQFSRRYVLPDDVKVEQLNCSMSSDGILELTAPKKSAQTGETTIPIRQTYRPAVVTPSPKPDASPKSPTPGSGANNTNNVREPRSQTIQIEREPASPNNSSA